MEKTISSNSHPVLSSTQSKAEGNMEHINGATITRKIDRRVIPLAFLAYFLQFLDKVIINYANIMGLQTDLGMSGQDFSWMATAFFSTSKSTRESELQS